MFTGSDFYIPYWWYMRSENTCTSDCEFTTRLMPPLCREGRDCITEGDKSIEEKLAKYVEDNIDNCLDDFEVFTMQKIEIEERDSVNAEVVIRKKDVVATLVDPAGTFYRFSMAHSLLQRAKISGNGKGD